MTTVMIWLTINIIQKRDYPEYIKCKKREKLETFYKVDMLEIAVHFNKHRWYKSEHSFVEFNAYRKCKC